ncbi:MAG: class I tRNA ligase family protein [Pseudonocardiaceae bacterium]
MSRYTVMTAIPYVNGKPHVGHALELVETDVLARHRRQRGDEVRFQTGTDDNALKNVQGAEAEGISPAEYVERVAQRFLALREVLDLSFDDFIKTSLPDTIFVHEYLTAGGQKISKSAGNAEDPTDIAATYGTDALRWWMLREVARAGDTDYTAERLVARANEDLANNLGNLANRTVSMVQRYRQGVIPDLPANNPAAADLRTARSEAGPAIDRALAKFDFRRAAEAVLRIGDEGNRYVEAVRPWERAKAERHDHTGSTALDAALAELVATCRDLALHLQPMLPAFASRIAEQCGHGGATVAEPSPVFPRLDVGHRL